MNSTPPFWDLSRESWDARSGPLLQHSSQLALTAHSSQLTGVVYIYNCRPAIISDAILV